MAFEDRIVTTQLLMGNDADVNESVALPIQLLARLPEDSLHVLVPRGPAPVTEEVLVCEAQLDTGERSATCVPVLVPGSLWARLPTAFTFVRAASRLLPSAVAIAFAEDPDAQPEGGPAEWNRLEEEN